MSKQAQELYDMISDMDKGDYIETIEEDITAIEILINKHGYTITKQILKDYFEI